MSDFHLLNAQSFADLIVDLFNAKYETNTYVGWGRSGQAQNGVDIYSGATKTVIQCKYRDDQRSGKALIADLKREFEQDVRAVLESNIPFEHFIMVSTYRHDVALQHFALNLRVTIENECFRQDRPFPNITISYLGWDELRKWILEYPALGKRYFSQWLPTPEPIELVNIGIDMDACSWTPSPDQPNTFYDQISTKSEHPVFDFSLINHTDRTLLLKSIELFPQALYSGLSGLPRASVLHSAHRYRLEYGEGDNVMVANPPLEIPKEQAFRFQVETVRFWQGVPHPTKGRNIFFFKFHFSSGLSLSLPKVFLNTDNDGSKIRRVLLN